MKTSLGCLAVSTASVLLAVSPSRGNSPAITRIVSGKADLSFSASGRSVQPTITPNGHHVVFTSDAGDLVGSAGVLSHLNVFVWERLSGEISLISVGTDGRGGQGDSVGGSTSDDGRFVAFQSLADNLTPNDTNQASDVFLRDQLTGTTVLISGERSGQTGFRRASIAPLLSAGANRLIFESEAGDLVANDTNNAADIFVYDRGSGLVSLVSLNASDDGSRAGASTSATITSDGEWVAFVNREIPTGQPPSPNHIYVRRLANGQMILATESVSTSLPGYLGAGGPALSANGSAVYFHAYNAGTTNLYRARLPAGETTLVAANVQGRTGPYPSANGRRVAFECDGLVRVWDEDSGVTTIVSVTANGQPAPQTEEPKPVLNASGTIVTFLSDARLTSTPTNGFAQLYQRDLTTGITQLLSGDAAGIAVGDVSTDAPAVTPDGRLVVFASTASTLVDSDNNYATDLFVRDVPAKVTALISYRDSSLPHSTPATFATLYPRSVSTDGRYVAYGSRNIGPPDGDTNTIENIYVRDLNSAASVRVSLGTTGSPTSMPYHLNSVISSNGRRVAWVSQVAGRREFLWKDLNTAEIQMLHSESVTTLDRVAPTPALSPDGRWVAFTCVANVSALDPTVTDQNSASDVVLRDVVAGTTTVVSRSNIEPRTGNGASSAPLFSPDGRWLAFVSRATNLTTKPLGGTRLFLRDLMHNVTLDVSGALPVETTSLAVLYAGGAAFSGDSQSLFFNTELKTVDVYKIPTGSRSTVCRDCVDPSPTDDAKMVALNGPMTAPPADRRAFVLNRETGQRSILSTNVSSGAYIPGSSTRDPALSGDGRYVVFLAESFDGARVNPSLYIRDVMRGLTMPLSIALPEGSGNGASYRPQLAADGRTLVFMSYASDLVAGDYNAGRDVFAYRIGSPDTDRDRIDDDWEMAYFNSLERDGRGDFDEDGQSDFTEFQIGTDPTNAGSVLSVMLVADLNNQNVAVSWSSVPGRTYDVQYKDFDGNAWNTLTRGVAATGTLTSAVDSLAHSQRCYRVVFAP